nr:hypothetical protein CFP56_25822 [Quercus suber]
MELSVQIAKRGLHALAFLESQGSAASGKKTSCPQTLYPTAFHERIQRRWFACQTNHGLWTDLGQTSRRSVNAYKTLKAAAISHSQPYLSVVQLVTGQLYSRASDANASGIHGPMLPNQDDMTFDGPQGLATTPPRWLGKYLTGMALGVLFYLPKEKCYTCTRAWPLVLASESEPGSTAKILPRALFEAQA